MSSLLTEFDDQFPSKSAAMAGFGVYIHIPFCAKRCDYCAFATWADKDHLMTSYVDACIAQYEREQPEQATSVFFGGGTPSLLEAAELVRLLEVVDRSIDCEVTVECNPETLSAEKLKSYYDGGVNRLSLGVQSFVPHVLKSLGRQHDPAHAVHALQWAHSVGFSSCNIDLIYGAFGESLEDWRVTLERAIELDVVHISAYALTIEAATPLAKDKKRHPNDDDQAEKYELANDMLSNAGYVNYEISNWAKPGYACNHNLLYWAQGNYAAIGCAAHGHQSGRRYWNVQTPERYIERVVAGEDPCAGEENLAPRQVAFEADELALRTRWGVPRASFDQVALEQVEGLLESAGHDWVRLTAQGRMLANAVAMELVSARNL